MAEQLTGTVIAEKYRLDSLLRTGELGDFYRGRHLFMDKPVTLKVLPRWLSVDDQIRDQFTAEARAGSALLNPHILGVLDFAIDQGDSYVVYEGFDGDALSSMVGIGGRFSLDRAISIARQIAEALDTAHANGFIHGNLTPDSVLVANTERASEVKVFDLEPADSIGSRRGDERSLSSVSYLAPENFSGLRPVDARSDIYSLGVILYQMIAGEVPFRGETPTDVMLKHAEEEPASISAGRKDIPAELEAAVNKALAKDPDERFQTAKEFIEALDKAAEASSRGSSGAFWKAAGAVVLGIVILASALIYATWTKQTVPVTQLQPDVNGVPVQPISPATGSEEQMLAAMPGSIPGSMSNSDIIAQPPQTLPGGDNYNPWATGVPPPGAPMPQYIPPGGQVYTIDPNTGSPFMPNDGGVILVPVPANTDPQAQPSPTPRVPAANANTQPAPPANTARPQQTPRPQSPPETNRARPSSTPAQRPGADQPSSSG
jgi:eukaryotic-like serine/threonine-protein kinase